MASIKGFQLKNVKTPQGREGYGCIATMYLDGKKIGTYADYGDGACETVDFVSKEAEEAMWKVVIAFAKEHPNKLFVDLYNMRPQQYKETAERFMKYHPYIPKEDITVTTMAGNSIAYIVEELLDLLEYEKAFKKYQKKGYRAISVEGDSVYAYPDSWSDDRIREESKGHTLYMSLDDFIK